MNHIDGPERRALTAIWQNAMGIQAADGLSVSDYLRQTAQKHIDGILSFDELSGIINRYYLEKNAQDASDPEKSEKNLLSRYRMINVKDLSFGTKVLEVYLNIRSEKDLWDHIFDGAKNYIERNERLCEAYFYMGKMHLMKGETTRALDYFKLARTTNVSYFLEHSNALLEIHMLDTENEYDDIGFDEKMVNSEAGTPQ
ncbi:hypothetical protein [uncultured Ruminobacter sp.]|uniref:hypothetical protein n=1 Tax=uncultured Ruminobacter sp. TaxID=538947 RepID=UPI0025DA4819|nr:hypothetical protein [uncultured Ruminobacter sp.]